MRLLVIYPGKKVTGGMLSVVNDLHHCLKVEALKVYYIQSHGNNEKWSIFNFLCSIFKTAKLLASKRVDVIYIHTASKGSFFRKSVFCLIGKLFRKKVILHMHGGAFKEFYYGSDSIIKKYISFILTCVVDHLIVLTDGWNDWFVANFNFKSGPVTIRNSVNKIKSNNTNNVVTEVIFVGRLVKEKGVSDLLKAIKNIGEEINYKVKIVGAGEDFFLKEALKLGITSRVEFLGQVDRETSQNLIGSSDILVLPSYNEGLPIVILEAMSGHTSVIATNVGGIPEIIKNNETGILIEPGDVESLTEALSYLIRNPLDRNRIANSANDEWNRLYTFEVNFIKIIKLLREGI